MWKMELMVDFQGFTKPINEFVLKELAALEVNNSNNIPVIILFEPPCDWNILPTEYKVTNSWLQRNYHGIPWSSGNSPYEAAGPIIRGILHRAHTIYVKGLEKKIWLLNLIGGTKEIVDLDSLGCPSLKNLRKSIHKDGGCSHHRSSLLTPKWNCASENVKLLKKWCADSL